MPLDKRKIRKILGDKIYSRALSYYRDGRVKEVYTEPDNGLLRAIVKGSGRNIYEVTIEFERNGEIIDAYCSCPYPDYCKHIGAVLLKYIEYEAENDREVMRGFDDFYFNRHNNEKKTSPAFDGIVELKDTGKAEHPIFRNLMIPDMYKNVSKIDKESAGGFRLIFAIEKKISSYLDYNYSSNGSRWVLKPALQYIKLNGETGRVEKYNSSKISYPLTESEYLLLSILERYINNEAPFEYLIDYFLPEEIQSDNNEIDLIDPPGNYDPSIKDQQQKPVELKSHKNKEILPLYIKKGRYYKRLSFLKIKKTDIRFNFFSLLINRGNEPLFKPKVNFYVDNDEPKGILSHYDVGFSPGVFFVIDDDNKKFLYVKQNPSYGQLIENLLTIDAGYTYSDIKKLESLVNNYFSDFIAIEFPTKQVRAISVKPKPILVLHEVYEGLEIRLMFKYKYSSNKPEQQQKESSVNEENKENDPNESTNIDTSYTRIIPSSLVSDILVFNKEEDGTAEEIVITWRDIWYEETILNYIHDLVEGDITPFYSGYTRKGPFYWEDEDPFEDIIINENIIDFLTKYGERLISDGFELWKDGKRITPVSKVVFTANWGIDWLDIKTEFQSEDGSTFDFNPETAIIEGNLLKTRDTYIVLNKSHVEKLKALYQHGSVKKDSIQISKYDISIIDELYQDLKNKDEENIKKIKKIIDGLKKFDGIKDVTLPSEFSGSLREYQKAGLNWLYFLNKYNLNGILADDMGLGKTVQVLTLILTLKKEKKFERALVVAPVSTLSNWVNEIDRFTPTLTSFVYHGSSINEDLESILSNDIVITSYGTLRRNIKKIAEYSFTYLILDEAQTIKNPISKSYKSVRLINAEHRLSLTGTPVENSTVDLWAQMNFLNPGLLGTLTDFKRKFAKSIEKNHDTSKSELLKRIIFPFILRRRKEDVLKDLPPKEEIILYATMDKKQKQFYEEIRQFYKNKVRGKIEDSGLNKSSIVIFEALLKLRQAAILPSLVSQNYRNISSCKFDLLKIKIEEVLSENHKALIFSQFRGSLSEIRKWIDCLNVGYTYLDGSTINREKVIQEFQNNEEKKLFIISLKAGGLGINLTASNYVFLFDPWWNPAVEMQAVDRSHRIGQENKVTIYKLITKDTVEEKIILLQEKKKNLVNDIISTEKVFFKSLNTEEIMSLFEANL